MKHQNKVAAAIRQYAENLALEKSAANEGAPDRLTVADGTGGVTTSKGSIPGDVGEAELKANLPPNAKGRTSSAPSSTPDRMTTADGTGGITTSKGTIPKDPGEAELKTDLPADGTAVKAASPSARIAGIRDALLIANPALAKNAAPAAPAKQPEKRAGNQAQAAPTLDLSAETLCKIASAILSTEEGISMTHNLLEKQAGEEAAHAQIRDAMAAASLYDETEQIKSAALNDLGAKAHAIYGALQQSGIDDAAADQIIKQAAIHQEQILMLEHPMLKAAYAQGMDDAELMAAAEEAGGAEGAPPADEAIPMGGEQLGEEEIIALLQEMLATGQITEADIMEALAAAGVGGEGGEGEAAAPVAEEEMPVQ